MHNIDNENYVYIKVKLSLQPGQTEDSVQEIVSELDYSFAHSQIVDTEITDIQDMQIGGE
ncbi:MAG: hypothetical protein GOVbin2277_81 [Prokaryotic dsDNA virus sp.]|jgi:hypothetical protein|nr:MAG: hypothetical protein GOVbin2277_81 [Prokaryotic dsDNA virus sp.]|tara:strand:- start:5995 stop:6174 length:180 start_codon:yes stop_codon:yes gene_type:complete